ncbi:Uma2 family endonuclease [Candidatus Poribacteria bacterium]|nr:Uma2 family endonuclease [Candidatus Poribacteria bacterium]
MTTYLKELDIPSVPTDESDIYPETDGKPMAVSDLHRRILIRTLQVLDTHFEERPEVYVSGDILMYYVEGDPRKSVAPDVLVSFGLGKKLRRTYKVWEEGKVPDFAMEFSSKNTYRDDLGKKLELYGLLGIQDYFLYDAEGLYLPSALMGFELVDDVYVPISAGTTGGLRSSALGLDFHVDNVGLGIYDPVADEWLQTPAESALSLAEQEAIRAETAEARAETAEARAEQETTRAETAEARAEQETTRAETAEARAKQAEAEAAKLQEQLARLQART